MLPESKLVISGFPGEERPITYRHKGEDTHQQRKQKNKATVWGQGEKILKMFEISKAFIYPPTENFRTKKTKD